MATFKHTHLSTRYDRPVETLENVLERYTKDSDLITLTEVDSERREKVIKSFTGWNSVTGDRTGRDDCAVMWDDDEWAVVYKETYSCAEYLAGNIGCSTAVLKHVRSKKVIVVSAIHLPSSVEGQGRVAGSRAPAWFRARRKWARRAKQLKRRYKADAMLLVADWNIDLKRPWVRALLKSFMPTWKIAWTNWPKIGTHGNRLIDFAVFKGDLRVHRRPQIHPMTRASDHRAFDEVFAFTFRT